VSVTRQDVNLFGDDWDAGRDRPGWQWKRLGVGERLGAERIGASLYELAPGQRTFPYHWHQVSEEWLLVLRGEPTLRDPSGERKLGPGDCVLFKRGPEGAHSIRNDTEEPVRLLMLSSDEDTVAEVCFLPGQREDRDLRTGAAENPARGRGARLLRG
jgi:uncharacterized cupin superfamily protein